MALDSYAALKTSVLEWLARPADPLVAPAVPDMVRLFEAEATQRLRLWGMETLTQLYASGPDVLLPDDFVELRSASLDGLSTPLEAISPSQAARMGTGGVPGWYTIHGGGDWGCGTGGAVMRLAPPPAGPYTVNIAYLRGLPPLSDAAPSNWLLRVAPNAYLWGTLVEALAYIGHDERGALWLQRRDGVFEALERADRKTRWGGPLTIRADMVTP